MTGTANSQQEIDQAIAIAKNTEGVKMVKANLKVQKESNIGSDPLRKKRGQSASKIFLAMLRGETYGGRSPTYRLNAHRADREGSGLSADAT